jgi:hypothetical protein
MTLSRRTALVGAGALAITAALPAQTLSLTTEERLVLAAVEQCSVDARAWTLETFRSASPKLRAAFLYVAAMTPAQADRLLARIDQS